MITNQNNITYDILLLGSPKAGKTSLMVRYTNNKYKDNYQQTIGCQFEQKKIEVNGKKIRLNLWDKTGSNKLEHTDDPTKKHAFIFVYDLTNRESFLDLTKYLEELSNYFKSDKALSNKIIILVGTKSDIRNDYKPSVTEKEIKKVIKKYSIATYIETSAKDNTNVSSLFETAVKLLLSKDEPQPIDTKNNKEETNLDRNSSKYLKETRHFTTIWNNQKNKSNEEKILALLKDYTKNNNVFLRIFAGYWNRSHIDKIYEIYIKFNQEKDIDLLKKMKEIDLRNTQGTVAIMIDFITQRLNDSKADKLTYKK